MNYLIDYRNLINAALKTVDEFAFLKFERGLVKLAEEQIPLLVCGNGGSAAIAEHMSCDHTKGICMDTNLNPYVIPLQSNVSLVTAIANDIAYDQIFAKQIEWFPNRRAAVLVISSSGNSPNVVNALRAAAKYNMTTFAMVGFDGGLIAKNEMADHILHVNIDNYGVVEDCHQILMHALSQSIRLQHTNKSLLKL
jgi:D-sedoheptulose 7-phosphate isomerase/D-glycero-D-manno-heptose 1,7-bisphosphate phosphatase